MGHPFSKFIPVKSSLSEDFFEMCGKQEENGWTVDPLTGQIKGSLTITLNYSITSGLAGATTHQFTDTLVFQGNDMKYEEFTIARPTN